MTVANNVARNQYVAIASQTVFSYTFEITDTANISVWQRAGSAFPDDAADLLTYGTDYTLTGVGSENGGTVILVTGATVSDIVTIQSAIPAERDTSFTPAGVIQAEDLNIEFDNQTLIEQKIQTIINKLTPRYPSSAIVNTKDLILPILGANQFWAKNPANTEIIPINVSDIIGGLTEVDTGLGLTGGPITTSGTISFAAMPANTFWGNITGGSALPTQVTTSYFLKSANNLSDLTNVPQAQINIGLEIGVNVQAYSTSLTSLAGLSTSANQIPYTTASNTWSVMASQANNVFVTDGSSIPSLQPTLPTLVQGNITHLGTLNQALNMGSHQINNVTDPTNSQDAATKNYVDTFSGSFLPLIGGTMQGAINMGSHKITNMTNPSSAQDAVTLAYLNTALDSYLALSGGTMTGLINMGSNKITNLTDPTNPQDAATKNYVDTVATGLAVQPACYAVTTTNLTATYSNGASGIGATLTNSGALTAFTTDGTTPATNSRILVWNQSTTFQNGIYTLTNAGSGAVAWILTRATDYDQPSEIQPGDLIVINNGTSYGGSSFIESASVSTIGTDPILFSQFTFSATAVLLKANNLSDVASTTTSFNNISPLTTKGDLLAYNSGNVRLAVGASNGQILQVSSGAATGLAWSTATYPTTTTINQILYSSSSNIIAGISSLAGGVLVTDASSVPQFLTNPSVSGKLLASSNAAIPTWTTPTYPITSGASGKIIISDGTNNVYSTPTFPNVSASAGKLMISDGTNWVASTPIYPNTSGTSGKILISDGTNVIYSTPTFPNASATARKIIISDGTNYVSSTETWATPGTSGNVLTSNGTNWVSSASTGTGTVNTGLINQLAYYASAGTAVSGLATATTAVLTTSSGVPTWANQLSLTLGGTNNNLTASDGGMVWSDSTKLNILSGTGTAGLALLSGNAATPSWSSFPPITKINSQIFSANGTYTPTAGTQFIWARLQGSGGGGGGSVGAGTGCAAAGGGGSGGYSEGIIPIAIIGASQAVTIDAGGAGGTAGNHSGTTGGSSSLGALLTAAGGVGGTFGSNTAINTRGAPGGVGGTAGGTSSSLAVIGNPGTSGVTFGAATTCTPGTGGASIYGSGGQGTFENTTGANGTSYGGGGAGAGSTTTNKAGGNGSGGFLTIFEFISS